MKNKPASVSLLCIAPIPACGDARVNKTLSLSFKIGCKNCKQALTMIPPNECPIILILRLPGLKFFK